MRVSKQIGGYSLSFCVEKNNHLVSHLDGHESNQIFHMDFNIYKKGDNEE